jgi:hypothetical protein
MPPRCSGQLAQRFANVWTAPSIPHQVYRTSGNAALAPTQIERSTTRISGGLEGICVPGREGIALSGKRLVT